MSVLAKEERGSGEEHTDGAPEGQATSTEHQEAAAPPQAAPPQPEETAPPQARREPLPINGIAASVVVVLGLAVAAFLRQGERQRQHEMRLAEMQMQAERQQWERRQEEERQPAQRETADSRAEVLAAPGRMLRSDALAILEEKRDLSVVDKIQAEFLKTYAQAAVAEVEHFDELEGRLRRVLSDVPPAVLEHLASVVREAGGSGITYATRKFTMDDRTGEGYYYDVKLMTKSTEDKRASLAARASGTSFNVRQAIVGYKEEKRGVVSKRLVKGRLRKRADCGVRTVNGARCHFPFWHNGARREECANFDYGQGSWCATAVEGTKVVSWDHCTDRAYHRDCNAESEEFGAEFEMREEDFVSHYDTIQHPILDTRILPEGVSQEAVMDALVARSAKQVASLA